VIFKLGEARYGLPLAVVLEVLDAPDRAMVTLPAAPDWVVGVLNHQGQVRPVLCAAALVGARQPGARGGPRQVILVELGGEKLGLLVEQVEGLDTLRTAGPPREDGSRHAWTRGTLVNLLEPGELWRAVEERLARAQKE
jgi:chemotaxis signal transduction protein